MRQSLGTVVFSGMIGVTIFGLFFTPVFYTVFERFRQSNSQETTAVAKQPV
jgi:multidrug efflux pump